MVSFSVPTREPVTLEMLDLQGRREARLRFTPTSLLPATRTLPLGNAVRFGLHFV